MTGPTTRDALLAAFAEREARGAAAEPAWLGAERRRAIARFAERGLPTTRDEEWKYTSLAPLGEMPLDLGADGPGELPAEEAIAPFLVGPVSARRLVFVDGRFAAKLSTAGASPEGGYVGSLAEALITDAEAVRPHLVATAEPPDAFGALNAAFWADGAFLRVPAGARLEDPVQLLFVATGRSTPRAVHPRSLVLLEPESRLVLVESYAALGEGGYLTNAMTDVVLRPGAHLDHHRIVVESRRAVHVGRARVQAEEGSRFTSIALVLGGRLVRDDADVTLGAEGAGCELSGLFAVAGDQHVDIHTRVDHARPRGVSRQLYKGVLDGRARGVFNGRVIVRPGANGTDAQQTNKNLLLSDGVEVDSKPQLEIFADDVKCSHGAADGQLGEEAVFYLKSRGLDEAAARTLLTHGFANEVLDRIRVDSIRRWCGDRLARRLRGGRVVEATS